jgi:hypothetical protein
MGDGQVMIGRATLNLIPLIGSGQTLEGLARQRGLARTLRDVAALVHGGLVRLEPKAESPAPVAPARPLRAAPVIEEPAPIRPQPIDAAPETVEPEPAAAARPLGALRAAVVRFFLTEEEPKPTDRLRRFEARGDVRLGATAQTWADA